MINLIIVVGLYWRLIKLYSKKTNQDNEKDSSYEKMLELVREFNRISNLNINILEDKVKELKEEVKVATEKINQLKVINKEKKKSLLVKTLLVETKKEDQGKVSSPEPGSDRYQLINNLIDKGLTIENKEKVSLSEPGSDRYQLINNLIDKGLTIEEIAKKARLSQSEIKLVSQLRRG